MHQEIIEACIKAVKKGDNYINYDYDWYLRLSLVKRLLSDGYHIVPQYKSYRITWSTYKPVGRLTLDNYEEYYRSSLKSIQPYNKKL